MHQAKPLFFQPRPFGTLGSTHVKTIAQLIYSPFKKKSIHSLILSISLAIYEAKAGAFYFFFPFFTPSSGSLSSSSLLFQLARQQSSEQINRPSDGLQLPSKNKHTPCVFLVTRINTSIKQLFYTVEYLYLFLMLHKDSKASQNTLLYVK
jgi:hypothetical protein